jgi:hypothetical protein
MKYPIICIVMLAGLLLGSITQAQTSKVSYTTIDVVYQGAEFDTPLGDVDGDGFRAAGSLALHKHWHVFGGYESNGLDDLVVDVNGTPTTVSFGDLDVMNVGIGINTAPRGGGSNVRTRNTLDRYSLFLNGQFLRADSSGSDRNGWAAETGFRSINFTNFEFIGAVGIEKFERADSELTLEGRLLYQIVKNTQLQVGAKWNDNAARYFIGARYNFGGFTIF